MDIHGVRDCFSLEKFLMAREKTKEAVKLISSRVFEGMSETQGHQLIDQVLEEMGAENKWHPHKFRIGKNTTKSFRDISDESFRLKKDDIFFIDIGPVWEGHEGDFGESFIFGQNQSHQKIIDAGLKVFQKTKKAWREENLSGIKLYELAQSEAEDLGYSLNQRMKGHRLGDFPHHLFYRGGMLETQEIPCDNLWVLEIHLISKDEQYGSFFEDILKK